MSAPDKVILSDLLLVNLVFRIRCGHRFLSAKNYATKF